MAHVFNLSILGSLEFQDSQGYTEKHCFEKNRGGGYKGEREKERDIYVILCLVHANKGEMLKKLRGEITLCYTRQHKSY